MSNALILYDLPATRDGRTTCWSANPWKIRLALNYKNIPYTTSWTEYPDIAPKFKSYNIPPNPKHINPNAAYSIPTLRLPDGRYIMDSFAIARELDKLYPDPPLYADDETVARAHAAVMAVLRPLFPTICLRANELVIKPEISEWFMASRVKIIGVPVAELGKYDVESVWSDVAAGLEQVKQILQEKTDGPYVRGREPSFADFVIAGVWFCLERLSKEGDLYGRVVGFDEVLEEHCEACRAWAGRDDH